MLKAAVVCDEKSICRRLNEFVRDYGRKNGIDLSIDVYSNGGIFLCDGKTAYDAIIIRVELGGMDGFDVAERVRKHDGEAGIIFVADSAKDAIKGYDFEASGYLVRPFEYSAFALAFDKICKRAPDRSHGNVIIKTSKSYERVRVSDILYVKKQHNYIVYSTVGGEYAERGSMETAVEKLAGYGFAQCNSGCLVNINAVNRIGGDYVAVGDAVLPISRSRRTEIKCAIGSLIRN